MRILLVEDDAETADYVARGLQEAGHVVDRAADGREGLFLASEGAASITGQVLYVDGGYQIMGM